MHKIALIEHVFNDNFILNKTKTNKQSNKTKLNFEITSPYKRITSTFKHYTVVDISKIFHFLFNFCKKN